MREGDKLEVSDGRGLLINGILGPASSTSRASVVASSMPLKVCHVIQKPHYLAAINQQQ